MSLGWLGVFRQGAWKSFRGFVLNERRDIARRLDYIRAELARIGLITVLYRKETDVNTGEVRVTEERIGFSVSRGSSLERLVQAYIAKGGNPLDISQFFMPDRTIAINADAEGNTSSVGEEYPLGGVIYPKTAEPNEPEGSYGAYSGGFIPLRKYLPGRIGGRKDIDADTESTVNYIKLLRKPVRQEIRYKIHDLEARIIKLCDLREQLLNERELVLKQAFGGVSDSDFNFDSDRYSALLRVPRIVDLIDSIFYSRDENGRLDLDSVNTEGLANYENFLGDQLPDEANHTL